MDADFLLSRLGSQLDLSNLSFSSQGTCTVKFDEDEVNFEKNGGYLFVIAMLGKVDGHEHLFGKMLEGNYLGRYSALGVLGIDEQRGMFTLSRVYEGDLSFEEFETELVLFIKVMRFWKQQIGTGE